MHEKYLASGFCHTATASDPREGITELVLYNPTPEPSKATLTVYFVDAAPTRLETVQVPPETNAHIVAPAAAPAVFTDCGFWGARVESTTPLVLNVIDGVRIQTGPPTFRGGLTNFRATRLHAQWYFPDGLWLEWNKRFQGDVAKAPFPFNELEYYHFLNPHPHAVEVAMTLQFRGGARTTLPFNTGYAVKIVCSAPIATAAVRYIYGLRGLDEWGMQVHCAMQGVPGPIPA